MIFCKIITILSIFINEYLIGYYLLNIFQQEHYNAKSFSKVFSTFYFKKPYIYALYLSLILGLINHYIVYIFITLLLIGTLFFLKKPIIYLKFTKRLIRIIISSLIINLILIIIFITIFKSHTISLLLITNILLPFIIILANIINKPIERHINNKYVNLAKRKLNNNKQVIKIGITGSFGKTSTKNIINRVLTEKYYTLATPLSYNTMMGITKTINDSFNNNIEILICEMGAYYLNEIKEMTSFIEPNIVVITDIGPQHLEKFGSLDNIIDAKFEIVENSNYDTTAILNYDNLNIRKRVIKNLDKIKTIGINYQEVDYTAQDIKVDFGITTFTICQGLKDELKPLIKINTRLLGRHNITNILLAYSTIKSLEKYGIEISDQTFVETLYNMDPVDHRLFYKKVDNIAIYDDSYNCNLVGAMNAIEVMSKTTGIKVIITPGMVELSTLSKEYHQALAQKIAKVFDEIYLIDNAIIKDITKILDELNKPYKVFKSFNDAYTYLKEKDQNLQINLLIENDLPDNYLERNK